MFAPNVPSGCVLVHCDGGEPRWVKHDDADCTLAKREAERAVIEAAKAFHVLFGGVGRPVSEQTVRAEALDDLLEAVAALQAAEKGEP
jgi:hypothetical protein